MLVFFFLLRPLEKRKVETAAGRVRETGGNKR